MCAQHGESGFYVIVCKTVLNWGCSWEKGVERTDKKNKGKGGPWDLGQKEREIKVREFLESGRSRESRSN